MTVAAEPVAPPVPIAPYKGLAPFEDSELDALLFFGRELERAVIGANFVAARLTVVYGPTGVGKSSLLAAGVVRDLHALPERPLVVVHRAWGGDCVGALTRTIADAAGVEAYDLGEAVELACALHGELYVVLDQVEEYFVYHGSDPALGAALAELEGRSELPVHVLVGVREDAVAHLDAFKTQVPGVLANLVRLNHLTREEGRRAIVGPVERLAGLAPGCEGLGVEPELVERVLDGVRAGSFVSASKGRGATRGEAGPEHVEAPYLQLVMQRLWDEERTAGSSVLRLSTLERLGGPARIVEEHLERSLAALTPREKLLAARMFHQLVTPSGTKIAHGTRDLAGYAAADEAEVAPVLAELVRRRILRPVGGDGRELHEIYHDVLADAVLGWRSRFETEQALELVRRRHRRALALAAVALAALGIVAAALAFALAQRSQARSEARRAQAGELDARALAALPTNPHQALADAVRAARLVPSTQAEEVLRTSLLADRLRAVLRAGGPVLGVAYSRHGRLLLTASADGKARIYDVRSRRLLRTLDAGAPLSGAIFDPFGRLVVTESRDGARVWSTRSGRTVAVLDRGQPVIGASFPPSAAMVVTVSGGKARTWGTRHWHQIAVVGGRGRRVEGAAFHRAGTRLITREGDRYARIYDTTSGRFIRRLDQGARVRMAAFSPSARLVVTAGANGIRVWRAHDGKLLHRLVGGRGRVVAAAVSPTGNLLAAASSDGSVVVWSLRTGRLRTVLRGHRSRITSLAFSPDGFSLVTTSRDGTARVWQPATGDLRAVLAGHAASVGSAAFSPDGTSVATAGADATARIWDPQIQPALRRLARSRRPIISASFVDGGGHVVVAPAGGGLTVRDARTGSVVRRLSVPAAASAVAVSPDGARIAAASGRSIVVVDAASGRPLVHVRSRGSVSGLALGRDGTLVAGDRRGDLQVWSPAGKPVRVLAAGPGPVAVAIDPGGGRLAAGARDGTVRIWDARSGRLQRVLAGHRGAITSVSFSSDGTRLVSASRDDDARVWNVATGRSLVLRGHRGDVGDARFSPDGRRVVTAGPMNAGLWDARTGALVFFLRGHRGRVTSASFDPAGLRILTSGVDGTVRVYGCEVCGGLTRLLPIAAGRLQAVR